MYQQPPPPSPSSPHAPQFPQRARSPHLRSRLVRRNPAFRDKLKQMSLRLSPLVQVTTGRVHPSFPATLLNFWLLTDDELEQLANFYHQRRPCYWTYRYPRPVTWTEGLTLEEKRRKMGKFIGLRGCETPVKVMTEEEIMDEARKVRIREDEEEALRRKMPWYS